MGIYIQYIYITKIVVLVSEPVRGRSRATELPCFDYHSFARRLLASPIFLCFMLFYMYGVAGRQPILGYAAPLITTTTRQSEMADLARRATRWVGTFPYILTPIPNLYDHSFPRYGQITFLTFRRPTTLTFDLKF